MARAGLLWLDEERPHPYHLPSFPVHTVDTLGAGDVFHGAFALAIRRRTADPGRTYCWASAAAALKSPALAGAFASPQRSEVEQLLSESRPRRSNRQVRL